MDHPRAKLDEKRRRLIRNALKRYSVEDCQLAILGCSMTPHNMGENDRGQRYDGINVIFRDADQIDRFMRNAESPPTTTKSKAGFSDPGYSYEIPEGFANA